MDHRRRFTIARVAVRGLLPLAAAAVAAASRPCGAEPYIALREGLKCATCHVNHTGGGMRNGYGALFSQTELAPLLRTLSGQALDFSPDLGSSVAVGANLIVANQTLFPVDEDLGSGAQRATYSEDGQNTFAVDSGSLYLQARLIPSRLSIYLDETIAPGGASSREAFALVEGLPASGYLKAGRLLPPYGLRLWDDAAFVRQVTEFNFDNQDLGLEVGFEPGPLSVALAVANGTQGGRDDNTGKQVSAVGTWWAGPFEVGASAAYNRTQGVRRLAAGPFASLRTGPLTWTGEADLVSESGAARNDQVVLFASADAWLRQAVNLRLAFDWHDPYDAVEEDERSRVTAGAEAFLTPFLSASLYYHYKSSVPQDTQGNADALTVGLHTFF